MPTKKRKAPRKKNLKGDGLYDKLANKIFGAKLSKGEIHAPQYTSRGFKFGSYIGPGTNLEDNLRKGKKPITGTDTVSQMHDINYALAKTPADVRAADHRMLNKIKQITKNRGDYKFNLLMGSLPIKLKMFAEDRGIIKPGAFAGLTNKKVIPPADLKLLTENRDRLAQAGYGKKSGKKSPWLTHVAVVRKQNPDLVYKQVLSLASKSYTKK